MAQSKSSGSYYALTAIGVGLLVLGVVMAVWNLVPGFGSNDKPGPAQGNSSKPENHGEINLKSKTFSVAYVLVGSGIALLLVAICLSVRSKRKRHLSMDETGVVPQEVTSPRGNDDSHEEPDSPRYSAPSYEEVMRMEYEPRPVLDADGNQRMSISLPSYESLNELDESTPTRPKATTSPEQPQRTNSRSVKEKKPLNVRRIKSDKLHLKEFRLNLSGRKNLAETQKIEPITPPPQYEDKQIVPNQPV
ncbi:PREDICTED: transmembrane protein 51 [Nanorana parkeri]|uniref:transmembrane protein 51 n=1 Tax=Nanorana parkeri TaxID=125878 RepID=UPI0008550B67|nr:PREDICTED: transmembrane protein 51 [Nanorana parkeri]XP_018408152.1 PREDICTED: transmembrane protein 51 [Nanorana parkeri]